MQKVIRRTILAEKQAVRKLQRRRDKHAADRAKTAREQVRFSRLEETKDIKIARKVRREDWDLGPLAPRRDVGDVKDTYGTIHTSRLRGEELDMKKRLEVNPSGGRYPTIVKGDRVVLLEGHDKGRIGKISEIDFKRQECTVEGLNMVCLHAGRTTVHRLPAIEPPN
jgi:large subunit ribosomal protein L24